ncbi:MAG TPA: DNA polymerase III subunit gamma/tau [Terriglobales bacterium]|jgi:DNA polymerase-3 subunit gamma/tau
MPPVIARRYRPQNFEDVIGQDAIVRTLRNAIAQGRLAHGYIFSGHRGIGKTTVARVLAKCLNCRSFAGPTATPCGECESCREIRDGNAVDVLEIDAASNRGIDEIRSLREQVRYRPARDRYKFFILDEAHQLTGDAFNALLKTLEEPPEWAVFVLATTEPEALPATIRSRCQHFAFRAVPFPLLVQRLTQICAAEKIAAEPEALELIAEAGEGSVRDALSLLDQAITHADLHEGMTAESVRALLGRVSSGRLRELLACVQKDDAKGLLTAADGLLAAGVGPAQICGQLTQAVRNALVAQVDATLLEGPEAERAAAQEEAAWFREEELARFLQILLRAAGDLRHGQQQRLHLELALVKMLHARRLTGVEEVLAALGPAEASSMAPRGTGNREQGTAGEGRTERVVTAAVAATAPAAPAAGDATGAVRRALEGMGKTALLTLVQGAEWRWDEKGGLELVFAAGDGRAAMVSQPNIRKDLGAACLKALGRQAEVRVRADATAAPTAVAAEEAVALPGSPEERAEQHPLLRQLREQVPTHVLRTRTLPTGGQ